MDLRTITYILRGIGIVLLLPSLFYSQLINLIPVLEEYPQVAGNLFITGVFVFLVGAGLYFYDRAKESRRKE